VRSERRMPRTRTLSMRGSISSWMKDQWKRLLLAWGDRPLSMTGSAGAIVVAVVVLGQVMQGELYIRGLNYPDATTLLMLCGVLTAGLVALRRCSDPQAVALSWVIAVSCLYAYEAIYLGALWTLWLLVGFPQLHGRVVHVQVLPWPVDRHQVYLINRCSKLALFITYFTLLPPIRGRAHGHASPEARPSFT